jgi:hypothetical protein
MGARRSTRSNLNRRQEIPTRWCAHEVVVWVDLFFSLRTHRRALQDAEKPSSEASIPIVWMAESDRAVV